MGISDCCIKGKKDKYVQTTAVILIDMQKLFVENLRKGEEDRIVPKQLCILEYCNKVDIPVVVLEFGKYRYGETIEVLMKVAQKNSNFRLIIKCDDDGFYCTDLHAHLKSLGVSKLFIMGINADFCVKATAESAIDNGYEIITSNEVISGQTHHSRSNSVGWFRNNGQCIDKVAKFLEMV